MWLVQQRSRNCNNTYCFINTLAEGGSLLRNMGQKNFLVKGHSHYCVFRVCLRQTVAFPQGDRKFPISALTQPTAENADRCIWCESAINVYLVLP